MNLRNSHFLKSHQFLLSGILFLGLALRLINIFSPILDLYPIRQEYCAMVARNFARQGLNIFNPQVDWVGNLNSYWSAELPIVSFVAALLYKIFGIHEFLGRLVAVGFSMGSIFFLYKLVLLYFDKKTALFSAFCFAILPLSVYFGRTFMPESTVIFFSIASIYLFSLWVKKDRILFFFLAVFATILTFLAKVSSLFICLPILFLFYLKYDKKIILNWKFWFCLVFISLPVYYWYSRSNLKMGSYIFNHDNLKLLIDPHFYSRLYESTSLFILTPLGLILFFLGFFTRVKKKEHYLFHVWFIAVVLYILLFPLLNSVHYYYQLPLVPVCCVFIGRSLSFMADGNLERYTIFHKLFKTKVLISIILFSIFTLSIILIRPFYNWNYSTYEAACLINKQTDKNAIIIAGRCTQEAPLYYCDRKGWVINEFGQLSYVYNWAHKDAVLNKFPKLEEIELVKYLIKESGAGYYLAANLEAFNKNSKLVKFMKDNYKVWQETDKYVIFALK